MMGEGCCSCIRVEDSAVVRQGEGDGTPASVALTYLNAPPSRGSMLPKFAQMEPRFIPCGCVQAFLQTVGGHYRHAGGKPQEKRSNALPLFISGANWTSAALP